MDLTYSLTLYFTLRGPESYRDFGKKMAVSLSGVNARIYATPPPKVQPVIEAAILHPASVLPQPLRIQCCSHSHGSRREAAVNSRRVASPTGTDRGADPTIQVEISV